MPFLEPLLYRWSKELESFSRFLTCINDFKNQSLLSVQKLAIWNLSHQRSVFLLSPVLFRNTL